MIRNLVDSLVGNSIAGNLTQIVANLAYFVKVFWISSALHVKIRLQRRYSILTVCKA